MLRKLLITKTNQIMDGYDKFFNDNQFETEQEKNDYLKGFEDVYYGY